jgi:hypothetical protein
VAGNVCLVTLLVILTMVMTALAYTLVRSHEPRIHANDGYLGNGGKLRLRDISF